MSKQGGVVLSWATPFFCVFQGAFKGLNLDSLEFVANDFTVFDPLDATFVAVICSHAI